MFHWERRSALRPFTITRRKRKAENKRERSVPERRRRGGQDKVCFCTYPHTRVSQRPNSAWFNQQAVWHESKSRKSLCVCLHTITVARRYLENRVRTPIPPSPQRGAHGLQQAVSSFCSKKMMQTTFSWIPTCYLSSVTCRVQSICSFWYSVSNSRSRVRTPPGPCLFKEV